MIINDSMQEGTYITNTLAHTRNCISNGICYTTSRLADCVGDTTEYTFLLSVSLCNTE